MRFERTRLTIFFAVIVAVVYFLIQHFESKKISDTPSSSLASTSQEKKLAATTLLKSPPLADSMKGVSTANSADDHGQQAATHHPPARFPTHAPQLEEFLENLAPGRWRILRKPNGEIMSLTFGPNSIDISNSTKARAFAAELASHLQFRSGNISTDSTSANTTLTKDYTFKQTLDGYEVYNGYITVLASAESGQLILVNSSLQSVPTPPPSQIVFTREQAWRTVQKEFGAMGVSLTKSENQPMIFVPEDGGSSELAWIFVVALTKPERDARRVIVGAQTGQLRLQYSILKH